MVFPLTTVYGARSWCHIERGGGKDYLRFCEAQPSLTQPKWPAKRSVRAFSGRKRADPKYFCEVVSAAEKP